MELEKPGLKASRGTTSPSLYISFLLAEGTRSPPRSHLAHNSWDSFSLMLGEMETKAGTADVERPTVVTGGKKGYGEALAYGLSGWSSSCLTGSSILALVSGSSSN